MMMSCLASRSPRPARAWTLVLLALLALAPAGAETRPVLFPPTPDGAPPQVRDERDVAPYLAAWKAAALRRSRALQTSVTPNQLGYDVHFYGLDLALDPVARLLSGTVSVKASVASGPLATLELDLSASMTVDAATSGGSAAAWSRSADVLTLYLDRAYATGETMNVTVTYHGTPSGGYFGFDTKYGRNLIWSLSEPFGARSWWPCKDAPEDKADSVDVRVTVPTGLVTASNGTRVESSDNGTVAVTRWQERHPIATYLVSVASYPYATSVDHYRYAPADSMPIQFYTFPEDAAGAAAVHAKVKTMIGAFAARFGEYPFLDEKYGDAEFLFGGGMEHQTCTSLGTYLEYVVAHELAHQWWGDWITCRDFHHIWLNEGFATYGEALWAEAVSGPAAYHDDLSFNKYFGAGTIYVPDLTNVGRIFSSDLSYNKASWVLHMLRHVLGDSSFFAALDQYSTLHAYSVATTEDFRDACEAVSGRDLHAFFQQWIYGEYYPAYRYAYTAAPAGGGYDVALTLDQTQSGQLFNMPLDVRVTTALGAQTFVIGDSLASQTFVLHVDAAPTALAIDPDDWVLKTAVTPVVAPPFDKGILLVNGVEWAGYGSEITGAYADRAFWGDYTVDFWDHFDAPPAGYPASLPAPLGHGAVPSEVLGRYRNLIWVGNNYHGDLASWLGTPILSYLQAGGNVLLLTRQGDQFLTDSLRSYLGINFLSGTTLYDCVATRPGLTDIARLGTQSLCPVFDTVRTRSDTQLLYKVDLNYTPDRGIGVFRRPTGGGAERPNGARFIFLSGRPYRWDHLQLRTNVMTMLLDYFEEPLDPTAVTDPTGAPRRLELSAPVPNPFGAATALRFTLPRAGVVRIEVVDPAGRRVRSVLAGRLAAGPHEARWDGRDDAGNPVADGIYWALLRSEGEQVARKLVRMR
ncbi:MAG: hypothetical protein HZC42_02370 [Candidatus Eisenbacteria bacterium]|nr:hypothetical protein [Candidatus Eisenbacteria bacterium]